MRETEAIIGKAPRLGIHTREHQLAMKLACWPSSERNVWRGNYYEILICSGPRSVVTFADTRYHFRVWRGTRDVVLSLLCPVGRPPPFYWCLFCDLDSSSFPLPHLISQEIKKYVAICLKPSKSTGPDRCPNELTKTMTDEEFQIVKMWVHEILTEDTSRQRETMNGTISQLHKGGSTNRPSNQRPVVLLNSVY